MDQQLRRSPLLVLLLSTSLTAVSTAAAAQSQASRYPVAPKPLADAEEVALARSAAPPEVSDSADVFSVSNGVVRRIHAGTSGAGCMVARDLHEGSVYPICFNPEGARTIMQRELLQLRLRSLGIAEDSVDRAVEAAYARGTLKLPEQFAIAYMLSARQVLFSSPAPEGVRVGAWHPHVMIYTPRGTARAVGLARPGKAAGVFQFGSPGTAQAEFVIKVPHWSDGTPAPRQ